MKKHSNILTNICYFIHIIIRIKRYKVKS